MWCLCIVKRFTRNEFSTELKQVCLVLFTCCMHDIELSFFFSTKWAYFKWSEHASIEFSDVFLEVVILSNNIQLHWDVNKMFDCNGTIINNWNVYPYSNRMCAIKTSTYIVVYDLATQIKCTRRTICWAWVLIINKFQPDQISFINSMCTSIYLFYIIFRCFSVGLRFWDIWQKYSLHPVITI